MGININKSEPPSLVKLSMQSFIKTKKNNRVN